MSAPNSAQYHPKVSLALIGASTDVLRPPCPKAMMTPDAVINPETTGWEIKPSRNRHMSVSIPPQSRARIAAALALSPVPSAATHDTAAAVIRETTATGRRRAMSRSPKGRRRQAAISTHRAQPQVEGQPASRKPATATRALPRRSQRNHIALGQILRIVPCPAGQRKPGTAAHIVPTVAVRPASGHRHRPGAT
jgi:hypothetical protein